MKYSKYYILSVLVALAALFAACREEHEAIEQSFVYFMLDDGTSQTVVTSDVNAINTYYVYLSTKTLSRPLTVSYEVEVGSGLQEGRDYQLLTEGNTLTFLPGVYDMPIRIQWIPSPVSARGDNTLTIRLTGNDHGLTMGMPGPDGKNHELIITKQ